MFSFYLLLISQILLVQCDDYDKKWHHRFMLAHAKYVTGSQKPVLRA